MCNKRFMLVLLAGLLTASSVVAAPLLVISIDGLHPAYVTQADRHGLRIPVLRDFVKSGTYASGVVGVLPTVTYPSHTTLVTGVAPVVHGIGSNTPFDPLNTNRDGWFWYAQDLKVRTLWQAASQAGLVTASVNWPVTVGDRNIRFLLPEYWRAQTADDLKLLRALSRPEGLMEDLESKLGPFIDGNTDDVASDEIRTRFGVALLRERKPDFMAIHLIALDGTEHHDGPFVPSAFATLESLDRMIGELTAAVLANDPASRIVIVSDHGFIATHTAVNLRTAFVEAGLITLKEPQVPFASPAVASWEAQLWPGGGSAAVVLRNTKDASAFSKTQALLQRLQAEARNGIARVLTGVDAAQTAGYPGAQFVIEFQPGFYFGTNLRGDLLTPAPYKGTHGYMPHRPEMHSVFFAKGTGIARSRNLGIIDMRSIAPTLAALMNVNLPEAKLQPLQ
ncbi:MAG TPA: ectonucleotide pyrophosphatase/phosphodiesterase, partial [Povalibacter sp.]